MYFTISQSGSYSNRCCRFALAAVLSESKTHSPRRSQDHFKSQGEKNQDEALLQLVIRSSDNSTKLLHRLLHSRATLGRIKCKCLSGRSAKLLYSCRGLTMQTQRCPSKGPGTIPALPLAALPCCQHCRAGHRLLSSRSRCQQHRDNIARPRASCLV